MKFRFLALLLAVGGCGTYHLGSDGAVDDMAGVGPGGDDGGIPTTGDGGVVPQRACGTVFTFHGAAPTAVSVAGEFNAWDPTKNTLTGPDSMGNWTATVMLAPGNYAYKVVTTDAAGMATWQLDPATAYTKYVGGVENSVVEVDDCKTPLLQFKALTKTADGSLHAEVQYLDGSDAAGIDVSTVSVTLDGQAAGGASIDGNGLVTVDSTGLGKTKHRLDLPRRRQSRARRGRFAAAVLDRGSAVRLPRRPHVLRLHRSLPQRRSAERQARRPASTRAPITRAATTPASQAAIDEGYFDALGVRTLWLSPPNTNPDGGFSSAPATTCTPAITATGPSAGRDVQPRFGTLAALKTLVQHAHAHGMRVIIDAVLNHVHKEHPLLADAPGRRLVQSADDRLAAVRVRHRPRQRLRRLGFDAADRLPHAAAEADLLVRAATCPTSTTRTGTRSWP